MALGAEEIAIEGTEAVVEVRVRIGIRATATTGTRATATSRATGRAMAATTTRPMAITATAPATTTVRVVQITERASDVVVIRITTSHTERQQERPSDDRTRFVWTRSEHNYVPNLTWQTFMACPMCILFKISPRNHSPVYYSRALVVVGSVWRLRGQSGIKGLITRLPCYRLEGLLPAAALQPGPVDPGCKE